MLLFHYPPIPFLTMSNTMTMSTICNIFLSRHMGALLPNFYSLEFNLHISIMDKFQLKYRNIHENNPTHFRTLVKLVRWNGERPLGVDGTFLLKRKKRRSWLKSREMKFGQSNAWELLLNSHFRSNRRVCGKFEASQKGRANDV